MRHAYLVAEALVLLRQLFNLLLKQALVCLEHIVELSWIFCMHGLELEPMKQVHPNESVIQRPIVEKQKHTGRAAPCARQLGSCGRAGCTAPRADSIAAWCREQAVLHFLPSVEEHMYEKWFM